MIVLIGMKIISKILKFAKARYVEYKHKKTYDYCASVFRERLVKNGIPADSPAKGEADYVRFWQQFHKRVEPYTYRYFCHLCHQNPHIVPEDIASRYIESVLNPIRYRAYYSDKNMYQYYITPKEALPQTYLYRVCESVRIGGGNTTFRQFATVAAADLAAKIGESVNEIVLKPTNDSNSGRGVMLFKRDKDIFKSTDGRVLTSEFLQHFGPDFAIQEKINIHPYLRQFSATSTNTIRVMTYRSVVDECVTVFSACLRIGQNGSFVDNLFSGGGFVMINIENGELAQCVYNRYWQAAHEINGINFAKQSFVLPFWTQVADFAKSVAEQIPHARLLAQDITIDDKGKTRLIEFNVDNFDWFMSMTDGNIPFRDKFDEVINYCLNHKNDYA